MKKNILLAFLGLLLLTVSCKTQKDLNYMQNAEEVAMQASLENSKSTIQPGDQLIILVSAKDMDVVRPFNQNYSSSELVQNPLPAGGNTPSVGAVSISGPSYFVDSEGNIDFPTIGQLSTTGKTVEEFKEELQNRITRYVINPTVSIRIANFKVTVLGEVNRQGDYTIPNGKATVLNALGLAGDLTMYGEREDVLIVRNVNGEITKGRINLLDANFVNSPYFNLKQNDVIYVSANETKQKTSRLDPNMPIYISVAGIVVTILALIFK